MTNNDLEIIKQAIMNEIEGYEFYRMAAGQVGNSQSKEAFYSLAEEELMHSEFLKSLFDKVKDEPEDDVKLAFLENPPSPNIYNWKKVDNQYLSLALSVFSIGVQMERDSIEFYENAQKSTSNEEAKKLYELLISWEKVHLEQFLNQYNIYKEEWWSEQGYSPF